MTSPDQPPPPRYGVRVDPTQLPTPVPASTAPAVARRRRWPAIAWTLGGLAVVGLIAFVHVSANRSYDSAHADLQATVAEASDTEESLEVDVAASAASVASADQIVEAAADDLADSAARTALADASAATAEVVASSTEVLDEGVDDGDADKPLWTWELFAGAAELQSRAEDASASDEAMEDAADALDQAEQTMTDAATALYASVPAAAAALEKANISARNVVVLDFRDAADAVAEQTRVGSGAAVAFSAYATRAQVLKESSAAELAEKAGPLYATRLEIEAYARSLSGGVVLDFDWAAFVAGTGGPWGIGGTATWNSARGGFSTITLSHSVAEWWPDADSKALVAHEVGHAITSKCYDKFDSDDQAANEEWATAWAISMGHTATGNGVQAYGYPSQKMIDIAATCR